MDRNPWIPDAAKPRNNPRQRQFLLLTDVNEVFYGGAAGGGKTYATLIAAAQFAHVPGYSALLLRENFGDLGQPGAWIPLSKSWWLNKGADWNASERRWTFPSGATITFGYLERDDDVYQYDTASYQFIAIDELVQHTEWRYRFMFGRIRRPLVGPVSAVPLRMRAASNPGGKGHSWVKKRFIDPETREPGAVFVPAKLDDNAGNMDTEAYRRDSLSKLDPLTRKQREDGDWNAVAGGRFKAAWFGWYRRDSASPDFVRLARDGQEVERFNWTHCVRLQTCDPAASTSTAADYFVLSTWLLTPRANLLWWGCERDKLELPEQVELCQRSYRRHRPQWVAVEEVLNQRGLAQLLRRSKDPAMVVRGVSPLGRDKLARASGFINLCHDGRVYLPENNPAFPLDDVVGELTRFTGDPKLDANDDIVDTGSYLAELLPHLTPAGAGGAPGVWKPKG